MFFRQFLTKNMLICLLGQNSDPEWKFEKIFGFQAKIKKSVFIQTFIWVLWRRRTSQFLCPTVKTQKFDQNRFGENWVSISTQFGPRKFFFENSLCGEKK